MDAQNSVVLGVLVKSNRHYILPFDVEATYDPHTLTRTNERKKCNPQTIF
jgi:hypothetical protein